MLSDVKNETVIKAGALELAQALNDVMAVLKNPTDAFKKISEEHLALQKTKKDHAEILAHNERVLKEHKESRVQESVIREKHLKEMDDRTKTASDMEKANKAMETSLKVRDSSLQSRDKLLRDKEAVLTAKDNALIEREHKLNAREKALKEKEDALEKERKSLADKHAKLKEAVG